jgi:Protein of unknown function (DUF2950)/Protein of unknown function (DUF3300)
MPSECLANLSFLEAASSPSASRSEAQDQDHSYKPFSPEQLDNLLAPIALYADLLLSQVLAAASFVDDVDGSGSLGSRQRSPERASQEDAPAHPRAPYHGYFVKILKRQGPLAPCGRYGYVINGNMIAACALITYTDKWGNSGVMTFIINQQGRV